MCPMILDYLQKINTELIMLIKDNETNCKQQLEQIVMMVKDLKNRIKEGTLATKLPDSLTEHLKLKDPGAK